MWCYMAMADILCERDGRGILSRMIDGLTSLFLSALLIMFP